MGFVGYVIDWWFNSNASSVDGGAAGLQPSYWNWGSENATWIDFLDLKYNFTRFDFRLLYNVASMLLICFASICISSAVFLIFFKVILMKMKNLLERMENILDLHETGNVKKNLEVVVGKEGDVAEKTHLETNGHDQEPKDKDTLDNLAQSDVQVQDKQLPIEKPNESLKEPNSSRPVDMIENEKKKEIEVYQEKADSLMNDTYFSPASGDLDDPLMTFDESKFPVQNLKQDVDILKNLAEVDEELSPLNSTQMDGHSNGLSEMNKCPFSPLSPNFDASKLFRKMGLGNTNNETIDVSESSFAWYGNKTTHNEDLGNVDLTFYQYPRGEKIPCLSSSGLRLESILRMAGIKYQLTPDSIDADVIFCPSIQLFDKSAEACGLRDCLKLIDVTFAEKIEKFKPSEAHRTKLSYFAKVLDTRLNWGLYLWRLFFEENCEVKKNEKIWSNGLFENEDSSTDNKVGLGIIKKTLELENGFSKEELIQVVKTDLMNISDLLGKNNFFGGKKITEIDCLLFSTLTQFLIEDLSSTAGGGGGDTETKTSIIQGYDNLYKFCIRIQEQLWPDWKWMKNMDEVESDAMKTPASSVQYGMKLRTPKSVNVQDQGEEKPGPSASSKKFRFNSTLDVQKSPVRSNVKASKSKILTPVSRK